MVERVQRDGVAAERGLLLLPVHARDPLRLAREELRGEVAERRDEGRPDQLDLAEQVRLAGLDLVGLRVAVPGRAALEDVRDVDVAAREPDPGEEPFEQLPRLADEGHALLVLVEAGRLADEHQVGVGMPRAEDHLRPPRGEAAPLADRDGLTECPEIGGTGHGVHGRQSRRLPGRPSVAAAAAAAAATTAAEARGLAHAVGGEDRDLAPDVGGAAIGAVGVLAQADELLEVRLTFHAHELVDRHGMDATTRRLHNPRRVPRALPGRQARARRDRGGGAPRRDSARIRRGRGAHGRRDAPPTGRPRAAPLPRAAHLGRTRVRPAEVPHAAAGRPRQGPRRGLVRAARRGGRGEPHLVGPDPQALVPGRAAAAPERAPRRPEPRRAASVAGADGRRPARGGARLPRPRRRGADRAGAGAEGQRPAGEGQRSRPRVRRAAAHPVSPGRLLATDLAILADTVRLLARGEGLRF